MLPRIYGSIRQGDLKQRADPDRREGNPPITVETAMWSPGGRLDWLGDGTAGMVGVGYAVPTGVNGGSELLIFDPRTAHSDEES
jgi:hypothetical protein